MDELFRSVIPVRENSPKISHDSAVVCAGSCFAEHIGLRLERFRFASICNPTGILFNPLSIEQMLRRCLERKPFDRGDLFFHDGRWRSFSHHSDFSGSDPGEALSAMNESAAKASAMLQKADFLILTFGTAAVYFHKQLGRVVANCHRVPQAEFERRLLSSDEIVTPYRRLFRDLLAARPGLRIILTVSPVRHLRDDPHENAVSKGRLLDAAFRLGQEFNQVYYFPAYEIMMDELRDYRFYGPGMAHPADTAVEYIWKKFCTACVAQRSLDFIRDFGPIARALEHRIQAPGSPAADEFVRSMVSTIGRLQKSYPEISLDAVQEFFQNKPQP
jgi:hypothetical protein